MSGRRFAILIASSRFPNEPALSPLRFPENDADGLSEVLRSEERGNFNNTVVLKNEPRDKAIRELHKTLKEARKDDLVVIYYSGHGKRNEIGHLHLATTDTEIALLESTSIPMDTIKRLMDTSPSNKKIIILDCCFSGAAGDMFTKGGIDDQLQILSKGYGTYIMTASTSIEAAMERTEDQYGVFTKHIIGGIRSGEADRNNDGVITIDELYDYVHDRVCAEGCGQEPMKWGLNIKGEMLIAKSGKTPKEDRRRQILEKLLELGQDVPPEILAILDKSFEMPKKPEPQPTVQKLKYQLRKEPITVSYEEARSKFKLNDTGRPLEYIQNDFKDNGDTITDHATGLIWQKSGSDGLPYESAKAYIQELKSKKFAGYDDWRLPTVDELKSLLTSDKQSNDLYIDPIFDETQIWCWTSDKCSSGGACFVGFDGGVVRWYSFNGGNYVRAVRSI